MPIDSAMSFTTRSLIPRDQYVFSANTSIYMYDVVMQRTTYLYTISDMYAPPIGPGINLGGTEQCMPGGEVIRVGGVLINHFDVS